MIAKLSFVLAHYWIALGVGFLSYLVGYKLTRRVGYRSVWEEIGFATGLGLGVIALLVFLLGLIGLLHPSILGLTLAAIFGSCFPSWIGRFRRIQLANCRRRALTFLGICVVIIGLGSPVFVLPLYPPTAFDATMYHLAHAKSYAQHHQMIFNQWLRYPSFPQNNEMLFTLLLSLSDDIAAQLVQFLATLLVAVALYACGQHACSPRTGWWAAALWLSNPLVLWLGAAAYVDVGMTLFATLAVCAFGNWLTTRKDAWLVLAGAFCGLAAGSKYSGLFFCAVLGFWAAVVGFRERNIRYPAWFSLVALAVVAPWLLRNCYLAGNLLSPFFVQVFGDRLYSIADVSGNLRDMASHGMGKSLRSLVSLPWNLTWNPLRFHADAPVSPVYLVALPLALLFGIGSTHVRRFLGVALAYTVFWFYSAQVLRYLLPAVPLVSLTVAAALDRLSRSSHPKLRWLNSPLVTMIGVVCLLVPGWRFAAKSWRGNPLPVTRAQRDAYLSRRLTGYDAYQFLNERRSDHYILYALYGENLAYFADGVVMGDWIGPARYPGVLGKMGDSQALFTELKNLGAQYFFVPKDRGSVSLPGDEFFASHFQLVHSRARASLFELTVKPVRLVVGDELLQNGNFENLDGQQPIAWRREGNPVVDATGTNGRQSRVAVLCRGCDNVFYQIVPVKPGGLYRLQFCARSDLSNQQTRAQVNWSDDKNKFLTSDIEVAEVGNDWRRHEMVVTCPANCQSARIYASPHEQSVVWYDDLSFVPISYQPEPSPMSDRR